MTTEDQDPNTKEIARLKKILFEHELAKLGRIKPEAIPDIADILTQGGTVNRDGTISYSNAAGIVIGADGKVKMRQGTDINYELDLIKEPKPFYFADVATADVIKRPEGDGILRSHRTLAEANRKRYGGK